MSSPRTIAALDVGSFKICCFIAEARGPGKVRVTGMSHQASAGIRQGMVVDMDAAQQAISSAVHSAEQMAGSQVHEVVVSLTGGQPRSQVLRREMTIGGGAIKDMDVRRLLHDCRGSATLTDSMLIHAVPVGYSIDGSPLTPDPRGMHGQTLGVRMTVVSAAESAVRNLLTCVARCHLEVRDLVVSPYAAGLAALVEDERDLGTTIVEMGAGTTSLAVFYEGAAIHTDVIPIGGRHVTNDISQGLHTRIDHAERLKTLYGNAIRSSNEDREMIDVVQIGEDPDATPQQVPRSHLNGIIAPRIEETMELVRQRLDKSGVSGLAGQRVVLTGGAAQLPGLRELAGQILDKQVRIGRPLRISGLAEATGGPAFATCAGLLMFAVDDRGEARSAQAQKAPANGSLFGRLGGWFRENF
ncbi:cell division protein FtsA [Hwanghaeella sp.]|uniref:cell division protein FtsA n=1 Tax=Hwanghaeella sp. TaxID=2605943 RepID=UPI003CCBC423